MHIPKQGNSQVLIKAKYAQVSKAKTNRLEAVIRTDEMGRLMV